MRSSKEASKINMPKGHFIPHTEQTKRKISIATKLAMQNPVIKEKISQSRRGIKLSLQTRLNMSKAKNGHLTSEKTRKKISLANKGRKHTKEARERISQALKGKPSSFKGKKRSEEFNEKNRQSHLGKKHTEETREKMSNAQRGEKSRWWKGGITPINKKIRNSLEYRFWREAIFQRDNWTCVLCGVRNGNGKTIKLQADHIKPFAAYIELRFDINNGRTLCVDCHRKTDTYAWKMTKSVVS